MWKQIKVYGAVLLGVYVLAGLGKGVVKLGDLVGLNAPWWVWSILLGIATVAGLVIYAIDHLEKRLDWKVEDLSKQVDAVHVLAAGIVNRS